MSDRDSQCALLLRLLKYGPVSAHDAVYRHGITRVAARIWDLKKAGNVIETIRGRTLPDGTVEMSTYRLVEPEPRQEALW